MKVVMAVALVIFGSMALALGLTFRSTSLTSRHVEGSMSSAKQDKDALTDELIKLEKASWVAWQNHDGKFFQSFLADDHVEVGFTGIAGKAGVVQSVASPICSVKSYSVDKFRVVSFNENTAVLTYHAAQDTTCGGTLVPSPAWVSSLYIKRGDRWYNAVYQQSQDTRK